MINLKAFGTLLVGASMLFGANSLNAGGVDINGKQLAGYHHHYNHGYHHHGYHRGYHHGYHRGHHYRHGHRYHGHHHH